MSYLPIEGGRCGACGTKTNANVSRCADCLREAGLCLSCEKSHRESVPCWLNEHQLRHHDCRCQYCHAVGPVDVSVIKEYGLTQKLSNSIRVY